MLQLINNSIHETTPTVTVENCQFGYGDWYYQPTKTIAYWNSYPVYVCTDKTAKAIEILKTLQSEKLIECRSVPKFIELVEKIVGLL